jgi:hypothetical protein
MPEAETIHILGEGGTVFELALPLSEAISERMAKGLIRRVNADGSPYSGAPTEQVPEPPTSPPALDAAKAEWVAWAITSGAHPEDAEAATQQDLIDLYGAAG